MQIKRIRISNFRSIRSIEVELGLTTVFIGPNNAGKTAFLEALRIALTRRWGQRGTGFTEYDVHLSTPDADPKASDPVTIEIELQEDAAGEWPEALQNELADIIRANPIDNRASILLQVSCVWDAGEEDFVPRWQFLNVDRAPLTGRGARAINLQEFFQFLPVFYLEALRDADTEFKPRSQFWGKLLAAVQIPEALEKRSKRVLDLLNRKLLAADPLLKNLADGISEISRVAASDQPGEADLRVLPLNTWDLLSKAEVIYQSDDAKPWLPLSRHGQGVQSLSVMFLFKAFVEQLLTELFKPESEAVLALEEPETHLHPQAARSLWRHVSNMPGQKVVTTHSPYFLQHVPFRDIRVVRMGATGTTVHSLPRDFRAPIPHNEAIDRIIQRSHGKLSYDQGLGELIAHEEMPQRLYRDLLAAYPQQQPVHARLRDLYERSKTHIPDDELEQLETFARRIRGEIFFARRWLLVEGQSEYHLVHGIADGLDYNLDEHGVSVIDFQNNGNPDCFAVLARSLGYPWLIVVDGDHAGQAYLDRIEARHFSAAERATRCSRLPAGNLEQQLIADGLQTELKQALTELGEPNAVNFDDAALLAALKEVKGRYAAILARRCATDPALAGIMPEPFRRAIQSLRGLQ